MAFGDINRVNTNMQAMYARFSLSKINEKIAKNQQELATGKKINSAEDNSAGFSIASKLTAELGGLNQASSNVGDAKSMLNVAESGMNSINDILSSMKTRAVQGATSSVGSSEKGYIAKQLNSLIKQINSVVGQTKFQGKSLLDGSLSTSTGALVFQVGAGTASSDTINVNISDLKAGTSGLGLSTISTSGTVSAADFTSFISQVDSAISTLADSFNQIGIDQKSLSIKQNSLQQQITSNSQARSSIMDANFAKLQSQSVKLQIEQQTATTAFAHANASSQAVLKFLK